MPEELACREDLGGTEETGEGVDDIMRRDLSTMMKFDAPAQAVQVRPSGDASQKLRQGRNRVKIGIELNQAIKYLPDHSAAIDVAQQARDQAWRGYRPAWRRNVPPNTRQGPGPAPNYSAGEEKP